MPAMYFVYVYYRMHIVRTVLANISNVSRENERSAIVASEYWMTDAINLVGIEKKHMIRICDDSLTA